jgi:hypothetical protein
MFRAIGVLVAGVVLGGVPAAPSRLAFQPSEKGYCQFDTGVLRGKMRLDGKGQGIASLVHLPSGTEIAKPPGLLSYYRAFSANQRYDAAARDWPVRANLLPDGALELSFPAAEEHPLQLRGIFRWAAPDTLDLETTVTPQRAMPRFEVFLSSYVGQGFEGLVYLKPNRFNKKDVPGLLRADWHPLVDGNYLMFPRDLAALQIIYDGRWEYPPSPVQWAVGRYLAGPLGVRRDPASGITVLLMAPPDDCFALAMPYNKTPPDGIANHNSLYLCLFGRDVAAGESVTARCRLVVKKDLTDAGAVELYQQYVNGVAK